MAKSFVTAAIWSELILAFVLSDKALRRAKSSLQGLRQEHEKVGMESQGKDQEVAVPCKRWNER